jgi:hypothetical protein
MIFLQSFQANSTIAPYIGTSVYPQIHLVFYPNFRRCIVETTGDVKYRLENK